MAERYSILNSLPQNLYASDAPVLIVAGNLLKDNETGAILAQIKLQSLVNKPIKAVTVSIKPLDAAEKPLGTAVTQEYLDLSVKRGENFGQNTAVMLPDASARGMSVSVSRVVFSDNTEWKEKGEKWEPLPKGVTPEQYKAEEEQQRKQLKKQQKRIVILSVIVALLIIVIAAVLLARKTARQQYSGDGSKRTTAAPTERYTEITPQKPKATPVELLQTGTPEPEKETTIPVEPETPAPVEPVEPETTLAGFTIGIDPTRDGGSNYRDEAAYNLEFAKQLKEYLESRGAKVVITREDNKKEVGNSKRAKIIKDAKCDAAIRLMCNEVSGSASGCFVQGTKQNESFARIMIKAYSEETGMKIQSGKGEGFDKVSDEVASRCGCPCVKLIMGNWKNKSDRANLENEAFQTKMLEAIYEALLSQLKN